MRLSPLRTRPEVGLRTTKAGTQSPPLPAEGSEAGSTIKQRAVASEGDRGQAHDDVDQHAQEVEGPRDPLLRLQGPPSQVPSSSHFGPKSRQPSGLQRAPTVAGLLRALNHSQAAGGQEAKAHAADRREHPGRAAQRRRPAPRGRAAARPRPRSRYTGAGGSRAFPGAQGDLPDPRQQIPSSSSRNMRSNW